MNLSSSKSPTIISSSPIRSVEKFSLPQFLRNNGGNRSGRRKRYSHSTPMFSSVFRKKNNIQTQEPSSPKVTCIGQVRVNKSKSKSKSKCKSKERTLANLFRCKWIQRVLCCNRFHGKSKTPQSTFQSSSFHRKLKALENSARKDPNSKPRVFASSPPKNALLLMRCRSEPNRASTMENRLWVLDSLAKNENSEGKNETREEERGDERSVEEEKDRVVEKEEKIMGRWDSGSSRPLILTRSKSEPGMRTGTED
ncbi:uncharacterized protein LOC143885335 [Tasmannia lanceolata]|uniref:uncharacterized protein LOC143885335 n=1 Tax=Tasmannia lanceolata TaxID=3420 RepID=UPI00406427E7